MSEGTKEPDGKEPVKIGPESRNPEWVRDDLMIALRSAVHGFVAVCDEGALGQIASLLYPVNAFAFALLEQPQQQAMTALVIAYANALRFDRDHSGSTEGSGE